MSYSARSQFAIVPRRHGRSVLAWRSPDPARYYSVLAVLAPPAPDAPALFRLDYHPLPLPLP